MRTKLGHGALAIVLVISAGIVGCGKSSPADSTAGSATPPPKVAGTTAPDASDVPGKPVSNPETSAPESPKARVTDRPANPKGKVFVIEYHHVKEGKGDMFRSTADFRRDLERLHKLGFRPVTVSQYLENKMDLAPGASPVVFTFDDSNPSQFQLKDDGTVDPNCAVGIWMDFAKKNPDFPVRGTFYVLPDVMWSQPKWVEKKVAMLREMGSELGSHTVTHRILKKLPDEQVKAEFGGAIDALEKLGETSPVSLALPFGIAPKNSALLRSFDWKGKKYAMKAAFLVGANPAPMPTDPKFDAYRIPRIQCYPGPYGIEDWLKRLDKGEVKLYVQ